MKTFPPHSSVLLPFMALWARKYISIYCIRYGQLSAPANYNLDQGLGRRMEPESFLVSLFFGVWLTFSIRTQQLHKTIFTFGVHGRNMTT